MNEAKKEFKDLKVEDYLNILNFLKNHAGEEYNSPKDEEDYFRKNKYINLKEEAKNTLSKFKLIGDLFKDSGLVYGKEDSLKWLVISRVTRVCNYLSLELKEPKKNNFPTSISIFAEKIDEGDKVRFRVSLEIDDSKSDEMDYVRHFRFLDNLDKEDNKFDYWDSYSSYSYLESGKVCHIKALIQDVKERKELKLQVGRVLYLDEVKRSSKEEIEEFFKKAVKDLKVYYDLAVMGDYLNYRDNEKEDLERINILKAKNQIFYGPPGTGKTFGAINRALEIVDFKKYNGLVYKKEEREKLYKGFRSLLEEGQIAFCTFHQSFGYEEFLEGLRSDYSGNGFIIKDGIFKKLCKRASRSHKNHVLIIDEINRGNISKTFGEIITLIEDDKRLGKMHEIKVTLPYSNERFGIPKNLYIIGTMNTADRSVAELDVAFRRRFEFFEYMPKENLLPTDISKINLREFLKVINYRIEYLLDREHTIGHSYFLEENLEFKDLVSIMKNKIIPLIYDYFYREWEKVILVLGGTCKDGENNRFIKREKLNLKKLFKGANLDSYEDEYRYSIVEDIGIEAFLNIYEDGK